MWEVRGGRWDPRMLSLIRVRWALLRSTWCGSLYSLYTRNRSLAPARYWLSGYFWKVWHVKTSQYTLPQTAPPAPHYRCPKFTRHFLLPLYTLREDGGPMATHYYLRHLSLRSHLPFYLTRNRRLHQCAPPESEPRRLFQIEQRLDWRISQIVAWCMIWRRGTFLMCARYYLHLLCI